MKLLAIILTLFLPYIAFAGHHEEKPAVTPEMPATKSAMPAMPAMPATKPAMPAMPATRSAIPAVKPVEKPATRETPAT